MSFSSWDYCNDSKIIWNKVYVHMAEKKMGEHVSG